MNQQIAFSKQAKKYQKRKGSKKLKSKILIRDVFGIKRKKIKRFKAKSKKIRLNKTVNASVEKQMKDYLFKILRKDNAEK